MAEKKKTDKKLKDLERKVEIAKSNLSNASTYSLYGTKSPYEIAKEKLIAAEKELQDYKLNKNKVNYAGTYSEDYEGQSGVASTVDSYKLGLITADDGTTYVGTTENILNADGKTFAEQSGTQQYIYIGAESYAPGGAEIRKGYVTSSQRPYEKGAYSRPIKVNKSFDAIKKDILTDAQKSPDGVKNLFDKLYRAGYISKTTADSQNLGSNEFNKGLRSVLSSYSKDFIVSQTYGDKSKEPISFDEYLSSAKNVGTSRTTYRAVATLKPDAIEDIDRFFVEFLGRGATPQEEDEYYKLLRSAEKKNVVRTTETDTGETQSGKLLTEEDRLAIKRQIAGKALNGSNLDAVLKTGAGAARSISGLVDYAKQYGIKLSNKDATDYLAQDLSGGTFDEQAIKSKITNISKATYSNLSELSDKISLRDLSTNLKVAMGEILELDPNGIDVMDPTIQKALKNNGNKGIMNLNDFEIMLRNDPRWARTKNAKEEASRYAYEILNSFGLMA